MTSLSGATTLITGAASGIGRATAELAATRGARLVLTDRDADGLATLAAQLGDAVVWQQAADVSNHDDVAALERAVSEKVGPIDIMMNIAGISAWAPAHQLTVDQWRRLVDVNLMGPIHVIERFLPAMVAAGRGGHIVNVSSAAGLFGLPWHAGYSASKFGLRGLSEVLRYELPQHKIRVSLVCPGAVSTPLANTLELNTIDRNDPGVEKALGMFLRRAVTPEQAAEAIVRGVERNRYYVYTSQDIRYAFLLQRKFEYPYSVAMRVANRYFTKLARKAPNKS